MAFALLEIGHRVAVVAFASDVVAEIPPGRGSQHFASVVRGLRAIRPGPTGSRSNLAACVRRLLGTASAFVVSDFLGPSDLRPDLAALRERCVLLHALQTHEPREFSLPGPGPIELFDVETGQSLTSQADPAAESVARIAHDEHVQRLERFAALSGIAYSCWDVAVPWQRVLLDHLVHARSA